jgi:signal transduction histidine kinase/DNA-binding response OmpR family regulator
MFKSIKDVLRPVYAQSLFVFAAFAAMAITSYYFMSGIERRHLLRNVNDAITNTQLNIETELREPVTALTLISDTVRDMILSNESFETVTAYLSATSNSMRSNQGIMPHFTGVYGVFDAYDGKFSAGTQWVPPEDFVPENRPWYKAALEADGRVAITDPEVNASLGVITIMYARRIFDEESRPLGVVCIDIRLKKIREYAVETYVTEDSYGILLDREFNVLAHPDPAYLGRSLRLMNDGVAIENELKQGREVSERKATDYKGNSSVLFIRQINNGWYMGILAYTNKYYQSVTRIAFILGLLGLGMAIILNVFLTRLTRAKNLADEENRRMAHWYVSILDTIPFPLSITDKEMRWTFVNAATEKFLKVKRGDILGRHCSQWRADICNTENCGIARVRQGFHQTHFKQDNASYQVDVEMLRDLNGEVGGYIEVVQDITKLEQMAVQQAEAEAASRAKSNFLAKVSHEIRTPMNAIIGIAEIQMQNAAVSREVNEALGRIHNSGYSLLGIINDILDFSKIEAGKMEVVPVKSDVASLIFDTTQLNMMRVGSKPIKFNLAVDPSIPAELFGDELRIKQILNNLLSNAFKYTESGEVMLSAGVRYEDDAEESHVLLMFTIQDTGQGMTQEQVQKLFNEYARFNMEVNRATEGTGLGMSIAKNLLDLMGGSIVVESEPGKGSTFTILIPQGVSSFGVLGSEVVENLRQFRLDSISKLKMAKMAQIVRDPMPYGKVLIVDDVETNVYVAKGLMSPYGLSADTAESGYEAIDKIKAGKVYDIVFMDHMMPHMDGIEATKAIRAMGYMHPVIALTANAMMGQAEVFLSNGFDDFISKPIDIRQLNMVLNKFVRDKQPPEVLEAARKIDLNKLAEGAQDTPTAADDDLAYLEEKLLLFHAACVVYDKKAAKEVIIDLKKKNWSRSVKQLLNTLTEHLLHSDFEAAANIARDYKEGEGNV